MQQRKMHILKYLSNKLFTWEWIVSSVALPPFDSSILNLSYPRHLSFLSPMLKGVLMNWKKLKDFKIWDNLFMEYWYFRNHGLKK